MKKNYLLLLIFLVLGAGTIWYLNSGKKQHSTNTLGWDRKFSVDNINEVHKIFIAKRPGETTTLVREGDHWNYNGLGKASQNAVDNVLEAIESVTLKFVPPAASVDNIVKEMAARGIKVELYDKNDKKIMAYYIGGVTVDVRGTYYIREGSEQPMAVEIPQMEGQIRTRFELTGDKWRDRSVFDYEPEEIEAVSIEYPKQRNKSFKLYRKGNGFAVDPFYDNQVKINGKVDNGSVEAFLTGFKGRLAESFSNEYAHKDSVRQTIPFSIVSLMGTDGKEKKITFYPYYRKSTRTGERKADQIERYFADVSNGDWMLTQHRVLQSIFWAYNGFFEPQGVKVKD